MFIKLKCSPNFSLKYVTVKQALFLYLYFLCSPFPHAFLRLGYDWLSSKYYFCYSTGFVDECFLKYLVKNIGELFTVGTIDYILFIYGFSYKFQYVGCPAAGRVFLHFRSTWVYHRFFGGSMLFICCFCFF